MFNVLVILLHRPFVSDGHLHLARSSAARDAFSTCSTAAFEIDRILRTYEKYYCFKNMPYIISYSTYVSATIHVRLAAQKEPGSDAHKALNRCLDVLDIHQTICWSSRRAKRVIDALVKRMKVVVHNEESLREDTADLASSNLDIDAIIRTFAPTQPLATPPASRVISSTDNSDAGPGTTSNLPTQGSRMAAYDNDLLNEYTMPLSNNDTMFLYDPIFGFNGSALDDLNFGFGEDFVDDR